MAFSPQVVEDMLVRSGRCCCLCHEFKGHKIEVHHIEQRADSGNDDPDNGIPLCFDCHAEVRAYDPRHPKGRSFPPSELKRHRDNWFRQAATAGDKGKAQRVSTAKLPITGPNLFGRGKELETLSAAWASPQTNVLSVVAWGGVGKSALVNYWLHQVMAPKSYDGARTVYGWSFYSQGTKEDKQASSDVFVDATLRWFGAGPVEGESPWEKGRRLADLVRQERTLLILDGVEPLQYQPGEHGGALRDPAIQSLICELAASNLGLCVITTRCKVKDLSSFTEPQSVTIDLEDLSDQAGAHLLESLGVDGMQEEREQASHDFEGHALALTLLGNYLKTVYEGDLRKRDKIPPLAIDKGPQGAHARRVMRGYENWFEDKPDLDILLMMGLFDRPAEAKAVEALRAKPRIKGLTDKLRKLSEAEWKFALMSLRDAGLLAKEDESDPDELDCHPLVREYFGTRLKELHPKAWKEGHSRLFDYYRKLPKTNLPDTFEEMTPLYASIPHGCSAGRYQEALDKVYWRRIRRGDECFSAHKHGAYGADLAAVSTFFEEPWTRVTASLRSSDQSLLLNEAGFHLRALGRMSEVAQPMEAGLEADLALRDWTNAATQASNLSEHHLVTGNITAALDYARQSVELANRSRDRRWRFVCRATLADALHQSGECDAADKLFREAEELQKEGQPEYKFLYSLRGYRYCDLLLTLGRRGDVETRTRTTLEWVAAHGWLLAIASDHLSLGRALMLKAHLGGEADFHAAADHLNQAVDGLQRAGQQDYVPRGLLARAELYRYQRNFDNARADLEEAERICTRCGLRLLEADCHLEYARLHFAQGEIADARERLEKARVMVDEMGYHRRDKDVAEIDAALSKA